MLLLNKIASHKYRINNKLFRHIVFVCIINVPIHLLANTHYQPHPPRRPIPRPSSGHECTQPTLSFALLCGAGSCSLSSCVRKGSRSLINWTCENCSRGKSDRGLLFECEAKDDHRVVSTTQRMMMKWGRRWWWWLWMGGVIRPIGSVHILN